MKKFAFTTCSLARRRLVKFLIFHKFVYDIFPRTTTTAKQILKIKNFVFHRVPLQKLLLLTVLPSRQDGVQHRQTASINFRVLV